MGYIHHAGVTVSDLDRSLNFYVGLLDLVESGRFERSGDHVDTVTGYPNSVIKQAFVRPSHGDSVIELLQYVDGHPTSIDPDNHHAGAVHIAVEVDDLDATLARLGQEGIHPLFTPFQAGAGPLEGRTVTYVTDPDNVRVELISQQ